MKRSSKSKQWAAKHSKDPFVKKSLRDKYRSRAAYKLQEINDKYKVLSNVHSVVDLGCAPGSWLQLINNFNIKSIIGIDLKEIDPIRNISFIKGDINDKTISSKALSLNKSKYDLVLSDIAPNITGIGDIDQSNFTEIADNILIFCKVVLKEDGALVMKYFQGSGLIDTKNMFDKYFSKTSVFKPVSSKKMSNEVYLICNGFKA